MMIGYCILEANNYDRNGAQAWFSVGKLELRLHFCLLDTCGADRRG